MASLKLLAAIMVVVVMAREATAQVPDMATLGQWMRVAARAGDAVYIERLLNYGVPPDLQDPNGFTPLMWASYFGRIDAVVLLLDRGANANHTNFKGDTSLMWASLGGFYDIVVDLIDHEAYVDAQEQDGWTALMGAAVQGHYDVAELLLNAGADKEITNVLGHAAVTLASAMAETEVVALLGDTTFIDHQDLKEMTPLHHAAASSFPVTLEKILEFCPDHTLRDENNLTALEMAQANDFTEGIALILNYINAKCTRFEQNYEVGEFVFQGCEQLVCHCTGRWSLTSIKNPLCGKEKNIIVTSQREIIDPKLLADCKDERKQV